MRNEWQVVEKASYKTVILPAVLYGY